MVDRKRIELFPKACKAPVLPLSLTAHLKILHQYIVFVKSKNQPYPIWIRFVRVRHTGVYRVPHAVGRFHPTRTFTKMVGMENFAISTSCLQNRPSTFDITSRLNWLGMMESNHHKQIQSLPHYHYANPQLMVQ